MQYNNKTLSEEGISLKAMELCHQRMAHVSTKVINNMISKTFYGMNRSDNLQKKDCSASVYSKKTKATSKGKLIITAQDMTLHLDICGLLGEATYGVIKYFLTMTTTPHRYTDAEQLSKRDEKVNLVLDPITSLERNSA